VNIVPRVRLTPESVIATLSPIRRRRNREIKHIVRNILQCDETIGVMDGIKPPWTN
jgi:hypothetical protein